jgi:6-phospho-beta-glucosidase
MKIVFVGGGSTYTPAIVKGFLESSWGAAVDEISLIDRDPKRLQAMAFLSKIVVDSTGGRNIITANERMRDGLEGADFIILQIRAGGLAGRHRDETLPLGCGCVGDETVGAGGFFHAMRVIPEVMKIAQEAAEVCPGAWFLVLSNPTGIIVRALLERYTFPVIGLCDVPFDVTERIASVMEVTPGSLKVTTAGLNHGSYVISIKQEEKEILPSFLADWSGKHEEMLGFSRELVQTLQAIPCVPYMRYFYNSEEIFKEQSERTYSRAQEVEKWQRNIFDRYEQQPMEMLDQLMKERQAPLYAKMITSVCGALSGKGDKFFACLTTRNNGVISEMPKDSVVEVPCLLSENRCEPEGSVSLPLPALAIVQHSAIYEKLAVQAAFNPCKESILKALLVNPLVGTWAKAVELAKKIETTIPPTSDKKVFGG